MRSFAVRAFCALALLLPALMMPIRAQADPTASLTVPLEYYRLDNGLRVVLAPDRSVPTVTVAVYYHIGFRIEPRDRTGFAHLFEHLMFQETRNLDKGAADQWVSGNGGVSNGSTRFDYTNYYEVVPSHVLAPVLWIEAERMRGLALSESSLQNQKDVVKNEVRVNILNQPYGGFPWLALPQVANQNWYNAHNFYGDLADIDAATLGDVRTFYDTYYVPSNAVLVVAGDFDTASTKEAIARDFGPLPKRTEPQRPDVSEPTPTMGRVVTQSDPKAPRPALAWGYPVPPRGSSDWYAFVLLDGILLQGEDSRLWRKLVQQRGYADGISGGINLLGSAFDIEGPTLWSAYLIHDQGISADVITKDLESSIREVQETPIGAQELARANTKIRSALYDIVGSNTRFGLVNLLASFALFDDDPTRINRIESEFRAVTPGDLQRVAQRYLTPSVRTQLTLEAGHGSTTVKP